MERILVVGINDYDNELLYRCHLKTLIPLYLRGQKLTLTELEKLRHRDYFTKGTRIEWSNGLHSIVL